MRLTRRAVLTIPGLALVQSAAAGTLRVEALEDGGFRVLGVEQTWEVTGPQLHAALGKGAWAEVVLNSPQVSLVGMLAGESVRLHLTLAQTGANFTIATNVRFGHIPTIQGSPRPFPMLLDERAPADAFTRGLGLDPVSTPHFTLDSSLGFNIVSHAGFALGHGMHVAGHLRLLPTAEGNARLAVIDRPAMRGRRLLGKRDGVPFVIEPQPARLVVEAGTGGARHLRLEGGGRLAIADARLRYGSGSAVRFTATGQAAGSWRLDLLLAEGVQRVDTPAGRVELSATGSADIVAEGGAKCVRTASARAMLRHIALRLPLQAGRSGHADIGRLDFAASTPVTLAVTASEGADSTVSRVPLAPQAGTMRIRLETADLWAGRDADMFRARFGFRGLDLIVRRRAPVLRRRSDAREEPTLIVCLPPQHVMEEAFPRLAPILPGRTLKPDELASAFDLGKRATLAEPIGKDYPDFARFSEAFKKRYQTLVDRQRKAEVARRTQPAPYPSPDTVALELIYIGPDGLITPLGRRAARETAYSLVPLPKLEDMLLGLGEILVSDVLQRNGRLGPRPADDAAARDAARALDELLEEAAKRQADMARVLAAWRKSGSSGPLLLAKWRTSWPAALRPGTAREALGATLSALQVAQPTPDLERALHDGYRSVPPRELPVHARAAGETRLAFTLRVQPGCTLPWALSTLLDWGAMELRVSRRAETRVVPVAAEADPSNELQYLLVRQLGLGMSKNLDERLKQLRSILRTGPNKAETAIELPARLILSPDRETPLPLAKGTRPTKGTPAGTEPLRPRFRVSAHPSARKGRVPLWRADLQETPGEPYSLRAIHTPDYEHVDNFGARLGDPLRNTDYRGRQAGESNKPIFALDDFDRRQLVALSSLYGLPVLARRGAGGVLQTSQVSPPDDFRIDDPLLQETDREEQSLYMPRALPTRLLRLTPLGGTLDLNAPFVPPAPLRAKPDKDAKVYENIFDAYSLERVRILITLGREVTTEVVYKGFLYPLGFRAALLKVTERQYLPWPATYEPDLERWSGPLAFQVQRYFIQVANPEKTFPGIAQPFRGRGWPARSLTMLTQRTPDLLDPTRAIIKRDEGATWLELPDGHLDHAQRSGLVFWPRTAAGESGNVRFRFAVDGRPEPVSMPLIFVDNQAAHDAPTMRALQGYWNDPAARAWGQNRPTPDDTRAWEALRRIEHAGVPRRYAEEDASGDTTFETQAWEVRVDSREEALLPRGPGNPLPPEAPSFTPWQMNAAMENADEPPFYPRCLEARIRHDAVARFTGNPQSGIAVRFLDDYLLSGLPVLTSGERALDIAKQEERQAEILAEVRAAAESNANGKPAASDPRREAFLRIVGDVPRQTMDRNGERAAVVMRPEMDYLFISRKGPVGGKRPAQPDEAPHQVPDKVEPDFVLPDARICGLVSLQSILEFAKEAAKEAAAPLLRQTVEYGLGEAAGQADVLAKAFAGGLLSALKPVMERFKEGGETGELLRNAYRGAYSAMGRLETALNDMVGKGVAGLPRVATAGRELRVELDRLVANPLGPLTELGQKTLSEVRDGIERVARERLNAAIPKIGIDHAQLEKLRDAFAPLGEALVALDAALERLPPLPTSNEVKAEAEALRQHAFRAFREATRRTFSVSPNKLPDSLVALRREWCRQVRAALDAEPVPGVPPTRLTLLHEGIEAGLTQLDGLPTPTVLDRFYVALRALATADWRGALRALELEGMRRLRAWAGSQLDGACSAAGTKVAVAATRLREVLLAGTVPRPCDPAVCRGNTAPAPAAEICARLWALCTTPELRGPAEEVGEALARIEAAVSGFGRGDPCQPSPDLGAARLMDELRRLDATRGAFVIALETLLQTLARVAQKQMEDAAAREAAVLAAALLALLRPPTAAYNRLEAALEPALGAVGAASVVMVLRETDQAVAAVQEALERATDAASLAQALAGLGTAGEPTRALRALLAAGRTAVQDTVLAAALPAAQLADDAAKTLLGAMVAFLDAARELRQKALPDLRSLDQRLGLRGEERLTTLLFRNLRPPVPDEPSNPVTGKDDLDRERDRIATALGRDATARANELVTTVPAWFFSGGDGSSVEQILRTLGDRLLAAARQKLLRVLNVDELRTKLETELEKLVPARRRLDYAWTVPGPAEEKNLGSIVTFRGGDFSVRVEAVLDLLKPAAPITGRVGGTIGDFDIGIKGAGAKWLTLYFSGIRFEAAPGASARVEEPKLKSFKPEGSLLFLAGLAAYCKLKDGDAGDNAAAGDMPVPNGIYTIPRPGGGAGLRAGYGLSIGALQIGTMAVLDVVFDAHVELPFDGDPGHAELSLSTPDKPATLVCAPYGGTAYAKMRSVPRPGKTNLATEFDVGFQFGAAVAISFSVLQGSGRVMTGLRVFDAGDGPGFSALFVAAFEGHIACFGIAASFVLALSYKPQAGGNRLTGTAALTYSFSIGPVKKSFTVHVVRDAGNGLETGMNLLPPAGDQPRVMLASASSGAQALPAPRARLRADIPGMMQDWTRYSAQFATPRSVLGRRHRA